MDKHERPYRCDHPGCEKMKGFTYSGGLARHFREVHDANPMGKQPLYCDIPGCPRSQGKPFTRRENLNEHKRRRHPAPGSTPSGFISANVSPEETNLQYTSDQPEDSPASASVASPSGQWGKKRKRDGSPSMMGYMNLKTDPDDEDPYPSSKRPQLDSPPTISSELSQLRADLAARNQTLLQQSKALTEKEDTITAKNQELINCYNMIQQLRAQLTQQHQSHIHHPHLQYQPQQTFQPSTSVNVGMNRGMPVTTAPPSRH